MQIHEITIKNKTPQLDEGVGDAIGGAAGSTVSGIKSVGAAIASPFKDIASGYQTGRADQRTAALADKFQRAWQQYAIQWAKSNGGQFTAPGAGAAPAQQTPAQQTPVGQPTTAPTAAAQKSGAAAGGMQAVYSTIQSLDNKALNGVAKILSQKVGPAATMAALKTPEPGAPMTEAQLNELGWNDIKAGAQKFGAGVKSAYQSAAPVVQKAYQTAKPLVKQAVKTGVNAIKAAPGAVATAAGGTVGAIAGMPARASTAYRASKATTSGPKLTMQELQSALFKLTPAQSQKLYAFVQQVQAARKAGIKEGIMPATLLPDYENALKAFVQKNMLAGMQYSRLQNANQIDDIISKLVDPANDSASAQKDLWNKLTLASSIAQHAPAGGAAKQQPGQPAAGTQPGQQQVAGGQQQAAGGSESAEELKQPIIQALGQILKAGQLQAIGQTVTRGFTNNNTSINSTGEPAVDALLINMGFQPS
jgi:hypothetical protein